MVSAALAVLLMPIQQIAAGDTLVVQLEAHGRELVVRKDLTIGSLDGPPETTFGQVGPVVETSDGRVVVADVMTSEVRVFDGSGAYLWNIGAEGEGPGEFVGVSGLALTPSGDVAVWDFSTNRLSTFTVEGAFLGSFRTHATVWLGGPGQSLVVDTAGWFLLRTSAEAPGPGPDRREAVYGWMRYAPEGEFIDSLIPPRRRVGGSVGAFRYETVSALGPDGRFVTGRNDEYALHRRGSDGRVARIEREYVPVPLRGPEREQWEAYLDEWESSWSMDVSDLPDEKPAWRDLAVDADGRIWVARYGPAKHHPEFVTRAAEAAGWPNVNWLEPVVYDVIDPPGRLLGTATFPARAELRYARGQHVWMVERGSFDEQYVVRYVMPTDAAGGPAPEER